MLRIRRIRYPVPKQSELRPAIQQRTAGSFGDVSYLYTPCLVNDSRLYDHGIDDGRRLDSHVSTLLVRMFEVYLVIVVST